MTRRKLFNFYIDADLADGLKRLKGSDPEETESSIVRRALRQYLQDRGVLVKTGHKRAVTRKRP
jgi:hypothetical protein